MCGPRRKRGAGASRAEECRQARMPHCFLWTALTVLSYVGSMLQLSASSERVHMLHSDRHGLAPTPSCILGGVGRLLVRW